MYSFKLLPAYTIPLASVFVIYTKNIPLLEISDKTTYNMAQSIPNLLLEIFSFFFLVYSSKCVWLE